jgi:hypothetical protein
VAPRVTRLLVSSRDAAEYSGHAARLGISLLGVDSVQQALHFAVPNLLELIKGRLDDADSRARILRHAFDTALNPSTPNDYWGCLAELAPILFAAPSVGPVERLRVEVVRDVASRRIKGSFDPAAARAWHNELLPQLPRESALLVAAHACQQASEFGVPPLHESRDAAQKLLGGVAPRDASPNALRLMGSVARIEIALGEFAAAVETNRRLLDAWRELSPDEASFPLTELFRIAATLDSPELFEEACATRDRIARSAGFTARSGVFLCVWGAHAAQLLRHSLRQGPPEADRLAAIANDRRLSAPVRARAWRLATALGGRPPEPAKVDLSLSRLVANVVANPNDHASIVALTAHARVQEVASLPAYRAAIEAVDGRRLVALLPSG